MEYIPFFFRAKDLETGPRFGGEPPNINPSSVKDLQYLLTVPFVLDESKEMSIYLNFDLDYMLDHRSEVLSGDSVKIIVHDFSRRSNVGKSSFPAHGLSLGAPELEESKEDPYDSHKIGGYPFLVQELSELAAELKVLQGQGYVLALQLDIPVNPEDAPVSVDWPFGDGVFYILAKKNDGDYQWAWFWQTQ